MKAERLPYRDFVIPVGGRFLLDPNEINGWGVTGPYDDTNTQDLGNVGANLNRLAGGYVFPFDVELVRFFAWHRNNNGNAEAWGWQITRQAKTPASNAVTQVLLLDETGDNGGAGPRDYNNTTTQQTDVDLSANDFIPAGETINLAVTAPTADGTNRYVEIMSGYFLLERCD